MRPVFRLRLWRCTLKIRACIRGRGIAQVAAEALSVNLRFGDAQGFFDGGFVCGVEHGFCKFGGLGFFFVAVETVGGVAERDGKSFGNGCCLRFFKGMNVHIDRFLVLRPFGGFGGGFVQCGAVGFGEAGDGNGLQTVVRRDSGIGEILTFFKGSEEARAVGLLSCDASAQTNNCAPAC